MSFPRRIALVAIAMGAAVALLSGCAAAAPSAPAAGASDDRFTIGQDFPDPDVLRVGDSYYAYATNGAGFTVQVATSPDLKTWTVKAEDALPALPDWAAPGKTWAPDVSEPTPGRFVMYVVTATVDPALQCIDVATADSPDGPFAVQGSGPIVCPADAGGAIDPSTFVDDDGSRYLVWKNDGNCCGLDTWLQIAPLSADGLSLGGAPTKLLKQTEAWEGQLVEAPTLVRHADRYFLFYSANDYSGGKYAIGYASSDSLLGPYSKATKPLMTTASTGGDYVGPGGQDVVTTPAGATDIVFHSWSEGTVFRGATVLPLRWVNGLPRVG